MEVNNLGVSHNDSDTAKIAEHPEIGDVFPAQGVCLDAMVVTPSNASACSEQSSRRSDNNDDLVPVFNNTYQYVVDLFTRIYSSPATNRVSVPFATYKSSRSPV